MVWKHHINCRIHAWFHTWCRCVLEKLMLTQGFITCPHALFWTMKYYHLQNDVFYWKHFCISPSSCVLHTPPDALITLIRLCKKYKSWNCLLCTLPHPHAALWRTNISHNNSYLNGLFVLLLRKRQQVATERTTVYTIQVSGKTSSRPFLYTSNLHQAIFKSHTETYQMYS